MKRFGNVVETTESERLRLQQEQNWGRQLWSNDAFTDHVIYNPKVVFKHWGTMLGIAVTFFELALVQLCLYAVCRLIVVKS